MLAEEGFFDVGLRDGLLDRQMKHLLQEKDVSTGISNGRITFTVTFFFLYFAEITINHYIKTIKVSQFILNHFMLIVKYW